MNDELLHTYGVDIDLADLTKEGYIKPHAYQIMINRAAEQHLKTLDLGVEKTIAFGLAWALVSLSVEIVKQEVGTTRLFATTWHAERRGPFFRRDMQFKNEKGELIVNATTFSVLLDLETRSIFRKKELPFPLGEPTPTFVMEASPSFREKHEYETLETRKINRSYIDRLGHVNNCRYGEFAFDALADDEAKLENLERMDIYFVSEMRPQDNFNVCKCKENNKIYIQGQNNIKQDVSFNVVFKFKE
ncbi:MAG: thioesterase [Oscillospiraceae bacterium]